MKKIFLLISALAISFGFGYAFKAIISKPLEPNENTRKVTGIGGIFFKCKEPAKVKEWYKTHLGFSIDKYGTNFEWREGADSSKYGFTQWSAFSEKTKYFEPSTKEFMINYRVVNLVELIGQLKAA